MGEIRIVRLVQVKSYTVCAKGCLPNGNVLQEPVSNHSESESEDWCTIKITETHQ